MNIVDINNVKNTASDRIAVIHFNDGSVVEVVANDVGFPVGEQNLIMFFDNMNDETPTSFISLNEVKFIVMKKESTSD